MRWLLILFFLPLSALAQTAESYHTQALEAEKKQDMKGALTALTYAISISPDDSEYRLDKAIIEHHLNLLDEALADCNASYKNDRNHPQILIFRSVLWLAKGQFQQAEADINEALAQNSQSIPGFPIEARLQAMQGDLDDALDTINQGLELRPDQPDYYTTRAHFKEAQGDLAGALADYRQSCTLKSPHNDASQYNDGVHWHMWIILAKDGQKTAADEQLSSYVALNKFSYPPDWHKMVALFLLGKISEVEFVTATNVSNPYEKNGRLCEAYYYSGIKRLLAGDKTTARADFKASLATKRMDYSEYLLALFELKQ